MCAVTVGATTRVRARISGQSSLGRIRVLMFAMVVTVAALHATVLRGTGPAIADIRLQWWLLVPLFVLGELFQVQMHFRREAHSFSMSELPLVLGLFFADPRHLLIAQLVGAALVLGLHRRQSALKLAFNLAQFALTTTLAVTVFRALAPVPDPLSPRSWLATGAAALVSGIVGAALLVTAISLAEGRLEKTRLPTVLSLGVLAALPNSSLGLIACAVIVQSTSAIWLLLVPAATLFLAYRAYVAEQLKHESLEFLYESTRILNETPELETAVCSLVTNAQQMFRSESAEMLLLGSDPGSPALRTSIDDDGVLTKMAPVDPATVAALLARLEGEPSLLLQGQLDHGLAAILEARGLRNALVAALRGETRVLGYFLIGNRLGDSNTFDSEHLRLFGTLANHASVALQNGHLGESLAQLRALEQQLTHQAFHDPLTGLANRSLFADRVVHALARLERDESECGVLFIDLDDFKTVNDTLGHAAGDQLLIAVAQRVTSCLRPGDTGARLGGDEFAVLLEDIAGPEDAARVAARITHSLRLPVQVAGQAVHVRASVGIGTSRDVSAADELLRNADLAMYMAKADGKGRFKVFEPSMRAAVVLRHELTSDLQRAAARGDFSIHYQPFHVLSTGRLVALEALVRWNDPVRGLIYPDTFIGLAEETGLIISIGRYVLQHACRQGAIWQQLYPDEPLAMSVNLSPVQFQQPGLVAMVADCLTVSGLRPGSLILEITEGVMLQDSEFTIGVLNELRELGVRIAMDDFGTGYSSLSYLRRLPIDILKIAKPFVDGIGESPEVSAFANAIVGLGQTLHLQILAEGIEHPWQARELLALGCELGQGYFFARPMAAPEMETLLRQHYEGLDETLATVIAFPA